MVGSAYRIFNKRTLVIEESIHVFDESITPPLPNDPIKDNTLEIMIENLSLEENVEVRRVYIGNGDMLQATLRIDIRRPFDRC